MTKNIVAKKLFLLCSCPFISLQWCHGSIKDTKLNKQPQETPPCPPISRVGSASVYYTTNFSFQGYEEMKADRRVNDISIRDRTESLQ